MKIVKSTVVTDAMLTSSTLPETPPAAYNSGTTYALDDTASTGTVGGVITVWRSLAGSNVGHDPASSPAWWASLGTTYAVYSGATTYALGDIVTDPATHRDYESLAAGNTGNALTDKTKWLDRGANNRWALFDNVVGTISSGPSAQTMVIRPGFVGGLCFSELAGTSLTVTMRETSGGAVCYSRTVDLDGSIVESVYEWFFSDFEQRTDVALTDLPEHYADPEITLMLTGTGTVGIGICRFGRVLELGSTLMGPSVGITSYSRKDVDDWGNTVIVKRANAKRGTFKVLCEKAAFNRNFRALSALDAVPCFYIGTDALGFEPLMIFGFFKDFSIDVEYPSHHYCNLEILGMI